MGLIDEKTKEHLKKDFGEKLDKNVEIIFVSGEGCVYCNEIREIVTTLQDLSEGKIKVSEYNAQQDAEKIKEFGVDKYPLLIITGENHPHYNVRFYGIPSGYEFISLIESIFMVSKGHTHLSPQTKEIIKNIDKDVHIQVFVTPTCPHCPRAVLMAHQMAIENPKIRGDMIEAMEFEELANKYKVMAVPKIVINDTHSFEGALPEPYFVQKVKEAIEGGESQ